MSGIHRVLPDYQDQVNQYEEARYKLCCDDQQHRSVLRDRQTIGDVNGSGITQGLERFLRRRGKTLEMMSKQERLSNNKYNPLSRLL